MRKQQKSTLILVIFTVFVAVGLLLPLTSNADDTSRFTDLGNGTIRDNETGLIWLKNANCFRWKRWDKAMEVASDLASGQCGLEDGSISGDWRLPSVWEWNGLFTTKYRNPALSNTAGNAKWKPGDPFEKVQNLYYWTSDYFADPTGRLEHSYCVYLFYGAVHTKERNLGLFVWPVRDPF